MCGGAKRNQGWVRASRSSQVDILYYEATEYQQVLMMSGEQEDFAEYEAVQRKVNQAILKESREGWANELEEAAKVRMEQKNGWEAGFLSSMAERARKGWLMSPKQEALLERILHKAGMDVQRDVVVDVKRDADGGLVRKVEWKD